MNEIECKTIEGIIHIVAGDLEPEEGPYEAMAAFKLGVHQTTIDYWIRQGTIPQWHWDKIINLSDGKLSADDLHQACKRNAAQAL